MWWLVENSRVARLHWTCEGMTEDSSREGSGEAFRYGVCHRMNGCRLRLYPLYRYADAKIRKIGSIEGD